MTGEDLPRMLAQLAHSDVVTVDSPNRSVKKGAALAYVAEQFGFAYVRATEHGGSDRVLRIELARDTSPEAVRRAAANARRFPHAGAGGAVPGLRRGTYEPSTDAERAVELLEARIVHDISHPGRYEKQVARGLLGMVVCVVVGTALRGGGAEELLQGAVVVAVLCAGVGGLLWYVRHRRRRAARLLRASGLQPVHDAEGSVRYVWPGGAGSGGPQASSRPAPAEQPPHPPQFLPHGQPPQAPPR